MLLHKAGQKVDENSMKKVLEAAGVKADASRIKALVAALDGVNIDEAIASAAIAPVAAPAAAASGDAPAAEAPKAEEKEEEVEEQAAAGLGALFG